MFLEKIVQVGKGIANAFKIVLVAGTALSFAATCKMPTDLDVTLHGEDVGTLTGKVLTPTIQNNQVVWNGIEGARVELENTDFLTTSVSNGDYLLDDVPTGSYDINARYPSSIYTTPQFRATTSAIVLDGEPTSTDVKLMPQNSGYINNSIVHGKIYTDMYKTNAVSNELVGLYALDRGTLYDLNKTTVTSPDGSYAFYFSGGNHALVIESSGENEVYFFDEDGQANNAFFISGEGVIERDAYLAQSE